MKKWVVYTCIVGFVVGFVTFAICHEAVVQIFDGTSYIQESAFKKPTQTERIKIRK